MYKNNRIAVIILFVFVCLAQAVWLITFIDCWRLMFIGTLDALGIIVLLPICILCKITILVLSIFISLNCKVMAENARSDNLVAPILDKVLMIISWVFLGLDIIAFVLMLVI